MPATSAGGTGRSLTLKLALLLLPRRLAFLCLLQLLNFAGPVGFDRLSLQPSIDGFNLFRIL